MMRGADGVRVRERLRGEGLPDLSFSRLLSASPFSRDAGAIPALRAHRLMTRSEDDLRGKVQRAHSPGGHSAASGLSKKLDSRLGLSRRFGHRSAPASNDGGFDARQRAVVKIHYFGHGGGGAAALKAHARYVAREAAARDALAEPAPQDDAPAETNAERQARSHADYLSREASSARTVFYDAEAAGVDGAGRATVWSRSDRRHFRIILAPEKGAELQDLKPYVRGVMARAEAALGTRLEWIAVDHWDTDNPHTHIVLRGRRDDGRHLVIPRDYVQHGFRNAARDIATERLGLRTRDDERLALDRETRAHRPTRLDTMIAGQVGEDGALQLSRLKASNGDANLTNALKARARELQRLGLAVETSRNVLSFSHSWRDQLSAIELHLDIRKRIMQERTAQQRAPDLSAKSLVRDLMGR